jgi:protein TonB
LPEEAPVEEPMAPPPAEPSYEARTGVYTAVPPGGTQPEEIDRVLPRYPAAARRNGVEGSVVLRGIVRRDGTMDEVEVIKDLPYGLGDAARRAVSRWRFRPATFRGEPIDVYYTVTVNFRLQ